MLTYHSILRVCLLIVHLPDLLVCGCVDLTQHAEPLAVGRREQLSTNDHEILSSTDMKDPYTEGIIPSLGNIQVPFQF